MDYTTEGITFEEVDLSDQVAAEEGKSPRKGLGINLGNIAKILVLLLFGAALVFTFKVNSPSQTAISMPEVKAIDFGSTQIRGKSQWMQIGQFAALVLALFIDTTQKRWRIKEDENRGSMTNVKFRLVQIWLAPLFTLLGVLFLVATNSWVMSKLLLEPKLTSAFLFAGISFFIAFVVSEGDVGFPAIGLGITALTHLFQASKSGALMELFSVPAEAKMYTLKSIFGLVSHSQGGQAKFSLLVIGVLLFSGALVILDILLEGGEEDNTKNILIALAIGIVILLTGTYLSPASGTIIVLVGALGMSVFDLQEFDETLALGIIVGTLLSVSFPM